MARKLYKVLATVTAKGGKTYEMRIGTAFTQPDGSIQMALDVVLTYGASTRLVEIG